MSIRNPLVVVFSLALLAAGACGCGSTHSSSGGVHTTLPLERSAGPFERGHDSADGDNANGGAPSESNDDGEVEAYGHPAGRADTLAAERFAKRYLAAAAAADGARACSMLEPSIAGSLGREYDSASAPAYLRGGSCATVLAKLFEYKHRQLVAEDFAFKVTAVRIEGRKAYALLAFARYPEKRFFDLERVGRAWKLNGLLDADFP